MNGNVLSGLSTTARLSDAIPTAENRLAPDGTLTHLQKPMMKADEYDQLIANPRGFIAGQAADIQKNTLKIRLIYLFKICHHTTSLPL